MLDSTVFVANHVDSTCVNIRGHRLCQNDNNEPTDEWIQAKRCVTIDGVWYCKEGEGSFLHPDDDDSSMADNPPVIVLR